MNNTNKAVSLLLVFMMICCAFASLSYGITQQEVEKQELPIYVMSPEVPEDVYFHVNEHLESKHYIISSPLSQNPLYDNLSKEALGEKLSIGRGVAIYDVNQQAWLEEYYIPIWIDERIETLLFIRRDAEKGIFVVDKLNGVFNFDNYRLFSEETYPILFFKDSSVAEEILAWAPKSDVQFSTRWTVFDPIEHRSSQLDQLIQGKKLSAPSVRLTFEDATPFKGKLYDELSPGWEQANANIQDELRNRGMQDQQLVFKYWESYKNGEFGYLYSGFLSDPPSHSPTKDQLNLFSQQGGFPGLTNTEFYHLYSAEEWISVPGYYDEIQLTHCALVDENMKVATMWLESQIYDLGYKSSHVDNWFTPYLVTDRDILFDCLDDELAEYDYFPITTPKSTIQKSMAKRLYQAGYSTIPKDEPARFGYLGGIHVDAKTNSLLKDVFARYEWNIKDPHFRVVLRNSLSLMEAKQAELASRKARFNNEEEYTRILISDIHPNEGYLYGVYRTPQSDKLSLPFRGEFHNLKTFYLAESEEKYFIDFCFTVNLPYYKYIWLTVTPGVPNKTTNQYERFFYPVTAKPAAIKADMQQYYNENGV